MKRRATAARRTRPGRWSRARRAQCLRGRAGSAARAALYALALNLAAQLHLMRRDGDAAAENAAASRAIADEHGFSLLAAVARILRGRAIVEQGEARRGIAELQRGLGMYRAIGADSGLPQYLAMLAEAHARAGETTAALEAVAQGLQIIRKTEERWWEPELYRLQGELALAHAASRGSSTQVHKDAEASFRQAIAIAQQRHARLLELRATVSLARLLQRDTRTAHIRGTLSDLYGQFSEGFATEDLRQAHALLADLPV